MRVTQKSAVAGKALGILILFLILVTVSYYWLGLDDVLSIHSLKTHRGDLRRALVIHPLRVMALFAALSVATAFFVPGATVVGIAAGMLFGFINGMAMMLFTMGIGSVAAFFAARWALSDWIHRRYSASIQSVDEGLKKEGAFFIFSLRLVPVLPLFLVNYALGVTRVNAWTFTWVSFLGLIPTTVVYVNAGTQLKRVHHVSDVLSPVMLASILLVGLTPFISKWLVKKMSLGRA